MIAVLTGAGMSAESGLSTFRDSGGLWEGYDVMEVASPGGWNRNPELVNDFYNQRRKDLKQAQPNAGHLYLSELEQKVKIRIVTQNVDDLHERAGSSNVLHLHGELMKVRSTQYPELIYDWTEDLHLTDLCERGHMLRPHVVWFGEAVPAMSDAINVVSECDLLLIIGTSLQVYPAAGLIQYRKKEVPVIYIDPAPASIYAAASDSLHVIPKGVTQSIPELEELLARYGIL